MTPTLIKKIFKNKPSTNKNTSDQNPDKGDQLSNTIEPLITSTQTSEDNKSASSPIDIPQLIVGVSHSVGVQRDNNEDSLFSLSTNLITDERIVNFGLFIIADGMGGHENGEIASGIAVAEFTSFIIENIYLPLISGRRSFINQSLQEMMRSGVTHAHQTIKKEALGGGTTLTALLIIGDQLIMTHVGDSRMYLLDHESTIQLLTHDHTLVKRLIEIGQISPEEASTHPQRNVLYRALGQGEPFEPDIATYPCKPGNILILCSDGLWGVVPEQEIMEVIISSHDPQLACQTLINQANAAGGPDNISVIIVQIPK